MWGGGGDCTRIFCAKLKQKLLSAAEKHPKIPCELESKGAWGTQKKSVGSVALLQNVVWETEKNLKIERGPSQKCFGGRTNKKSDAYYHFLTEMIN